MKAAMETPETMTKSTCNTPVNIPALALLDWQCEGCGTDCCEDIADPTQEGLREAVLSAHCGTCTAPLGTQRYEVAEYV